MAAASIRPAQANHAFLPPVAQSGGNNSRSRRIAQIVIPIIIALASFFFLPANISFVITAAVTIGAFVYNKNNNITPLQPPLSKASSNDSKELPSESTPSTKPPKPSIHSIPKPKTPAITRTTNAVASIKAKSSSKLSATKPNSSAPSIKRKLILSYCSTPQSQTPLITKTISAVASTKDKPSSKLSATKPGNIEGSHLSSYRSTPQSQTPQITRTISASASVSERQTLQPLSTPLFTAKAPILELQSKPLAPNLTKIQLRTTGMDKYPPTVDVVFKTVDDVALFQNKYGNRFSNQFRLTGNDSPTQPAVHIYWTKSCRKASNTADALNILKEIFGEVVVKEKCQVPEHLETSLLPNWMRNKRNAVLKTPSTSIVLHTSFA